MPKYVVQDTHIKHASEGKKAKVYAPGDDIELTKKEAKALGANVKPAPAPKKEEKPAPTKDKKDEKQTPVKDKKKEGSKPGGKK